ncbi:MAG: helicase-exonuclease AddAB subunit AddB [Solirubrobacterales bacterium]
MSLRYIYGRAGSGKSSFCLFDIKREIDKGNERPIIFLVPEQFSFQSEKKIIEVLGEAGAFRVQVLSFKRMAEKVFNQVGGVSRKHMNNAGRSMLIYSIMEKNREKLQVFKKASKNQGFIAGISELITEFKRYSITPEKIMESINSMEDLNLKSKLSDVYLIYSDFEKSMDKRYIDTEDDLTILGFKIDDSDIFNGAYIWMDEFSSFTPQEYKIIEKLFTKAKKINITLCSDGTNNELFLPVKSTEERLNKIIQNLGIKYDKPIWLDKESARFKYNDELSHMEKYLFSYPYKQYEKKTESISIFRALNSYSEVEETAAEIIRLCRDKGIMYRDIAVVSGDLEGYESIIRAVFSEYGISYFIDKKSKIINSPLIVLIVSALEIITKNWSYETVFRYLKTGLLNIDQGEVDLLENYVLANGIKGKRWTEEEKWENPLHFDYNSSEISEDETLYIERINKTRNEAAKPLLNLSKKIKGRRTFNEITKALYEFICEINIPETIEKLIFSFETNGQMDRAAEYKQVWDIIVEIMEQLVQVMGDEAVNLDEYTKILNSGFQEYEIGIIPPAIDQVLVGSIQRLKSHEISVLFILGTNDGVFPSPSSNEGVLTDDDRIALINGGLEVSRDSKSLAFEEQFLIYSTLTRANEYLRLSFPAADFEGKTKRPSIIISRLKKIFKGLTEYSNIIKDNSEGARLKNITSKQPLLNQVLAEMGNKDSGVLNCILNWYYTNEPWKSRLINGAKGYSYKNSFKISDTNKIRDLYGKSLNISVSRLEKYVDCPFSYFVQYGLKASERKIYKLAPPDLGSLMHEALHSFSISLKESGKTWADIEESWAEEKISMVVEEIVNNSAGSILKSSKRYGFIEENVKKTLKRSVELIALHIKRGEFEPIGYEMSFGIGGDFPPISMNLDSGELVNLIGKIDRVDMLQKNGETYIRIIDYKSGNKEFKINDIYYGLQMQLLIYLDAILSEIGKRFNQIVIPGGVMYFRLDDPIVKTSGEIGENEISKGIMKALKMNGLILNNISVINSMDSEISGTSDIIPVSINKDSSISNRSSCVDQSQFDILRNYVKTLVKKICCEILKGNVEINPYKKKGITSCTYCSFSAICQFEEGVKGNKYRILKDRKEEELWKLLEEETEQKFSE